MASPRHSGARASLVRSGLLTAALLSAVLTAACASPVPGEPASPAGQASSMSGGGDAASAALPASSSLPRASSASSGGSGAGSSASPGPTASPASPSSAQTRTAVPATPAATVSSTALATAARPLAGLVIALDPGHQLGNSNPKFSKQINTKRFNGRIWKICNTTGTSTDAGFPEATFTWDVALKLRAKLQALGATVPMTRSVNSWNTYGPCTWDRGMFGAKVHARLMVQIHADGAPSSGHGFHIIYPGLTTGWTDHLWHGQQIWKADRDLARAMKRGLVAGGMTVSTYITGGLSEQTDQMAMNYARIPTVTVENGNMRNAAEARRMSTSSGQAFYAAALLKGIRTYLGK